MKVIRQSAYARAGLIGNPSDGYGGKTISFTLRNCADNIVMYPWERLEILWSQEDKNRFDSIEDLVNDVNQHGYYGGVRLVKATIRRFADFCRSQGIELHSTPFSIRYETNIPRGVGLSGSSAIVTATLKGLMRFYDVSIPLEIQPSIVRSVENDELDIACGYQDRVVQVYGGLVYMDFGMMQPSHGYEFGDYAKLESKKLPPIYIAYDEEASKTSASVHGPLRTRVADRDDLRETMDEIAALVPQALVALETQDAVTLHALLDKNFDLRAKLYDIKPAYHEMVTTARSVGASAKFAGSGGAIVGTIQDDEMYTQLCEAMMKKNVHWRVIRPDIG